MKNFIYLFAFAFVLSGCSGTATRPSGSEADDATPEDGTISQAETETASDERVTTPRVFFQNLKDGDVVSSPFTVEFGVEGMEVEPAGEVREGYGHHHLLVNKAYLVEGEVIPTGDESFHYGNGEAATQFELSPGKYMLSLQFGDGVHVSYGEEMSSSVNITVE